MNEWMQGVQIGANIASNRLENSRRMQELKSAESLRRLQEAQIAQRMQLEMEQNNLAIEARAETQKAIMRAGIESSPFISMPTPNGPVQIPNPIAKSQTRALFDNLVPLAGKYGGPEAAISTAQNLLQRTPINPQIQTLTDPATGKNISMVQTGPNTWRPVPPEKPDLPLSTFGKLQADLRAAIQRGDNESTQQLRAKIDSEAQSKGMSIKTNPDGTVEILQGGAQGAKLPTTTIADAERVANSAASFVNTGREIIDLAKMANVGAMGNLKRFGTRIAGQILGEDYVSAGEEFDFAQAVTFFRAAAGKILKTDSQVAEAERREILKNFPTAGIFEAPTSVKRDASNAIKKVAESARRQIQRAGVALPPELMTPDEIAKAYNDDTLKISEDEAVKLMRNSIFDQ